MALHSGQDLWSADAHEIPGTQAAAARDAATQRLARSNQTNPPGKKQANPKPKAKPQEKAAKTSKDAEDMGLRTIIVQLEGAPQDISQGDILHQQQCMPRQPQPAPSPRRTRLPSDPIHQSPLRALRYSHSCRPVLAQSTSLR